MNVPLVDLKTQYKSIKTEIDTAIQSVIDEAAFIKGEYVQQFERSYAKSYGVKHVVSCANGTDAIYITLKALGIGLGDEVITTAFTWISTAEAVTQTGAKVVFVDIEPDYYSIDVEKIEEKITKNTKVILPVHLYGHPANMDAIMSIAKKYGLYVVEDCAQAHLAQWNGKNVGTFGVAGTFSFFPSKNLGAYGDAGCIVSDDGDFAVRARMFANHGSLIRHQHETTGINSRMDGIQAAILSVKLRHLDEWNNKRIMLAERYNKLLNGVILTPPTYGTAKHVFHLYVIRAEGRDDLRKRLSENGIATGVHYPTPLPFLKAYSHLGCDPSDFLVARACSAQVISIPMHPDLTGKTQEAVTDTINLCLREQQQ